MVNLLLLILSLLPRSDTTGIRSIGYADMPMQYGGYTVFTNAGADIRIRPTVHNIAFVELHEVGHNVCRQYGDNSEQCADSYAICRLTRGFSADCRGGYVR